MEIQFSHIVEINELNRTVRIERLYSGGRREIVTEIAIPDVSTAGTKDVVAEFALMLAENLLLDSPKARRLLYL
jgi:hypothetical protein